MKKILLAIALMIFITGPSSAFLEQNNQIVTETNNWNIKVTENVPISDVIKALEKVEGLTVGKTEHVFGRWYKIPVMPRGLMKNTLADLKAKGVIDTGENDTITKMEAR